MNPGVSIGPFLRHRGLIEVAVRGYRVNPPLKGHPNLDSIPQAITDFCHLLFYYILFHAVGALLGIEHILFEGRLCASPAGPTVMTPRAASKVVLVWAVMM
jgi:hypothetical protein